MKGWWNYNWRLMNSIEQSWGKIGIPKVHLISVDLDEQNISKTLLSIRL